jgi:hypothetical protein
MPKIMREMVYIDAGGRLSRGFGRCYPAIVWHQKEAWWTACELPTPQDWGWGGLVTVRAVLSRQYYDTSARGG